MTKKETLDDLKQTIVETAAEAVVAAMTPAMMRKCAEEILATVLSSISGNQYGDLGRMVTDKAQQAMKEYLETEQAQQLINATVRRAVNDAVKNLDERLSVEVTQTCIRAVAKALTQEKRW
jgi:hypothetical protein